MGVAMMLEKVILWTILLDLLGHSLPSGDAYSTTFKFDNQGWKESLLACRSGSRLPSISKSEEGQSYRLSDHSLQNSSTCFWLGAAYDTVDSVIGDTYPGECCETIRKTGNDIIADYVACKGNGYYKYVCAKDEHTVTRIQASLEYVTWKDASIECATHHFQLPLRNNSGLLASLNESQPAMWTRSVLRLNINQKLSPDQIPICFCNQQVQFFKCPQRLTTFCMPETGIGSSHTNADFATLLSASSRVLIFPSRSLNVNTASANVQIRTSEKVHTTGFTDTTWYSITSANTTVTLSKTLSVITYVNMSDVPRKSTEEKSIKDNNLTDRVTTTWPIIGGSVGALVVLIVVVITIIIVLKRHRMKNDHDTVMHTTNNNTSPVKDPSQTSLSCDSIIGQSSALQTPIATLPLEEESVVYAMPQKVSQKSPNLMENEFKITQSTDDEEKHGLYSKVQKGQRTHEMSKNIIESGGLGMECQNISFVESENAEYLGNVYNKANFHVEQTMNMYDKADFRLEGLDIDTGNDYDMATFHRSEHSRYDTTGIVNATFDSTYDRLN